VSFDPAMVAVHVSILSASGKAEIPSSLPALIINVISSFCRRLHALPWSPAACATDIFGVRERASEKGLCESTRKAKIKRISTNFLLVKTFLDKGICEPHFAESEFGVLK
jgi:hypothetical protein